MFHNLAVPVLHLFILIVKFLSLYVDELNDDDDDDILGMRLSCYIHRGVQKDVPLNCCP